MSAEQEPALEFLQTSKWYGQITALTDISVRFTPGVTGLVGQNGAGKSTMMKLACGLLRPSYGVVTLLGDAPHLPATRRNLGYCADVDRYYEHQSGVDFVQWMLRLSGMRGGVAKARAAELLESLGLQDAMRRPIRGYSKGMRQRVKLAVALGHDPKVLLLDEPLTGLDPIARQELVAWMRRLGDAGTIVVVSSHVLHELETVADRVVLIHQGAKLAEGTVAKIREKIGDRPRRVRIESRDPRGVASKVFALSEVTEVVVREDGIDIATAGGVGVDEFFTELGASGLVDAVIPLDDSLESVFGYLVK